MKNLFTQKLSKKMISVVLCFTMLFGIFAFTGCQPAVEHADANKDHKCDCGCTQTFGSHADANYDHVCDYGCKTAIGVCEDADKDHKCDYGCSKVYGEHADANKDHKCDYGCKDAVGKCEDIDTDHACDYGCDQTFGEHVAAEGSHNCAYCDDKITDCVDTTPKDHKCDVCETTMGDPHVAAENSHNCAYCGDKISDCVDETPKDHECDICGADNMGVHQVEENSHNCAYCGGKMSDCVDTTPRDHECDICGAEGMGTHAAAEGSHNCAYCNGEMSNCVDANPKDHVCDICGVGNMGQHADSDNDNDHVCDYCKSEEKLEDCSDVLTDNDHNCDVCGAEGITQHVYGEWQKNDNDTHKHICNCGKEETKEHKWNDGEETTPATHTSEGVMTYTCTSCGETKTASIPTLTDHTYNQENIELQGALVSEATCTNPAVYKKSCICGLLSENETFEYGETAAHTESEAKTENSVAPTCTNDGSYETVVYCSVCETYEISRTKTTVPATGHQDTDGDLYCDNGECDEQFYVITLDGATATANSKNSSTVSNAFVAGEQVILMADAYKTVEEVKYMFVGFDLNAVDNRIGKSGYTTVTYTMPAEAVSITAKYAEANTTFLSTYKDGGGWVSNPEGMTGEVLTDSTDPDLEGLAGWKITIPADAVATSSVAANLNQIMNFNTWGPDQEKTVRFVLKNHGKYDVTVEFGAEYFGKMSRSGNITVPAGETVIAIVHFDIFLAVGDNIGCFIHLREDVGGKEGETIQLDVVAAAAKTYTNKISSWITTGENFTGNNGFLDIGEATETELQSNRGGHNAAGGMNLRYWDQYGLLYFYDGNNNGTTSYIRERANAIGGNSISNDSGVITLYVKATNLYYGGGGKYTLIFANGNTSLSETACVGSQVIEFTEYGQTYVYEVKIDVTKYAGSGNIHFGLKQYGTDSTDGKTSVLIQIASENIFGQDPVNE